MGFFGRLFGRSKEKQYSLEGLDLSDAPSTRGGFSDPAVGGEEDLSAYNSPFSSPARRSDVGGSQPVVSPQVREPSPLFQETLPQRQVYSREEENKDIQLILSKLDLISSRLENVSKRLEVLEQRGSLAPPVRRVW